MGTDSRPMAILNTVRVICSKFMPHILMIWVQISYSFLYFLVQSSFNHGMNAHVFITYRYIVSSLVMFPLAYFLERNVRPKLTFVLFLEIFASSLLGASLTANLYFASLRYTSPAFITSMTNTVPSITFITAVILRLEILDLRNPRGIAKIVGTLLSLAGVLTITLYKGPAVPSLQGAPVHIESIEFSNLSFPLDFLFGLASNTDRYSDFQWRYKNYKILQQYWLHRMLWIQLEANMRLILFAKAYTLKRYPAQLSLTAWISGFGATQSAVFTVFMQHKPAAWCIRSSIVFWTVIYAGVTSCSLTIFLQLWCTKQKGPVFVTMFSPLATVLVAIMAYVLFGEELHAGCILGGAVVIIGLYMLLWGKENDQDQNKSQEQTLSTDDEEKLSS